MGKHIKYLTLFLSILFLCAILCGCGKKTLSQDELAEIHRHENELKQQLVGKTWHQEDEPQIAYYFGDDGIYIEYLGTTIQWSEDFVYDVKFGSWAADDFYGEKLEGLEKDRLEYYEYGIVGSHTDEGSKPFFNEIEFDGDTLVWAGKRYVIGPDWPYRIPDDATIDPNYLGIVLWDDFADEYYLFYDDGTGFMCNTIFDMTNEIWGPEKFYWGFSGGYLYMSQKREHHEEIVDDIIAFSVEKQGQDYVFTDRWNNTTRIITDAAEDPVGIKLQANYDKIHDWISDWA